LGNTVSLSDFASVFDSREKFGSHLGRQWSNSEQLERCIQPLGVIFIHPDDVPAAGAIQNAEVLNCTREGAFWGAEAPEFWGNQERNWKCLENL
jgi:hypothetical protein